ncbi:DUF6252 family protein [Fibrella aestuarina]|uniref:DUF6252 family protein n=1 Tax=Fibrella aestuarina TaxID=651143 RepID=UPI0026785A68
MRSTNPIRSCVVLLRLTSLVLADVVLSTCSQDPLPRPSQSGQNTFGCLINGNAYVPDGGPAFSGIKPVTGGLSLRFGSIATQIGIFVLAHAKDKQQVNLLLNNSKPGRYPLTFTTAVSPAAVSPKDYGLYISSNGDEYVTSANYTGWINLVKADTTTGIVAGTFEFTAATPGGRTVTVTNGRFDVNPRTQ